MANFTEFVVEDTSFAWPWMGLRQVPRTKYECLQSPWRSRLIFLAGDSAVGGL